MSRGVLLACPGASIDVVPMADGGEGTVDALVAATGGSVREALVTGPRGESLRARFGLLGDGRTAVLEMAAASGLVLVPPEQRNPLVATTRGTGELMLAAMAAGANRLIVGIGGSATNDGGAGLGQALGFRLLDARRARLEAGRWRPSAAIADRFLPAPDMSSTAVEVAVACDVTNPLCGPSGASAVYGPQKGATPEMVELLDRNLAHFASIVERDLGVAIKDLPGSGAAGGLGGGLVAFAGGKLSPGIELVIKAVDLESRLEHANLCLTGEGCARWSECLWQDCCGRGPAGQVAALPCAGLVRLDRAWRVGCSGPGDRRFFHDLPGADGAFGSCEAGRRVAGVRHRAGRGAGSWRGGSDRKPGLGTQPTRYWNLNSTPIRRCRNLTRSLS